MYRMKITAHRASRAREGLGGFRFRKRMSRAVRERSKPVLTSHPHNIFERR